MPPAELAAFADTAAGSPGIESHGILPAAFVFLSPGCPACQNAIPLVEASLANAHRAGLDMRVLLDGGRFNETAWLGAALGERATLLTRQSYRMLNPRGAVPSYLFVDGAGLVQASGYIGDEEWQAMAEQLAGA